MKVINNLTLNLQSEQLAVVLGAGLDATLVRALVGELDVVDGQDAVVGAAQQPRSVGHVFTISSPAVGQRATEIRTQVCQLCRTQL